jgi:hypothetical protein
MVQGAEAVSFWASRRSAVGKAETICDARNRARSLEAAKVACILKAFGSLRAASEASGLSPAVEAILGELESIIQHRDIPDGRAFELSLIYLNLRDTLRAEKEAVSRAASDVLAEIERQNSAALSAPHVRPQADTGADQS